MIKLITSIYDLEGIRDRKGQNDPKVRATEIFAKMDKNYSNSLDSNEFVNGEIDFFIFVNYFFL